MVEDVTATMRRLWSKDELQRLVRLHNFIATFSYDGKNMSNEVYYCLQMTTSKNLYLKVVSREALNEMRTLFPRMKMGRYPYFTRQVKLWHAGGILL